MRETLLLILSFYWMIMNFLQKLIYSRKLFKYFIPQIHNNLKLPFVIRHKSRGAETEETMKLALSKKSSSSQRVDYIKDCDYIGMWKSCKIQFCGCGLVRLNVSVSPIYWQSFPPAPVKMMKSSLFVCKPQSE